MFAPRRVPPCLTASVAWLKTRMNETGPLRDTLCRADLIATRTQTREGEARPATGLVDQRRVAHRPEDRLHRVLDGQHEACGQLLQLTAGVHERRRVRQELERRHQVVEVARRLGDLGFVAAERDARRTRCSRRPARTCRRAARSRCPHRPSSGTASGGPSASSATSRSSIALEYSLVRAASGMVAPLPVSLVQPQRARSGSRMSSSTRCCAPTV